MLPLILIIHLFLGSTVAGILIIAALTMGYDTAMPIIIAGAVGFVLSMPLSWYVVQAIYTPGE